MKPGAIRFSTLLRLPVVDSAGARMGLLDVRTSEPAPPTAPAILGLLLSPHPRAGSRGLKRHDAALSPRRRRTQAHSRYAPWHQIASINLDAVQLHCRFEDLPAITFPPPRRDSTRTETAAR